MALKYFVQGPGYALVMGMAADTKPPSPPTGWTFIEEDTGKVFRASGAVWVEQINSTTANAGSLSAGTILTARLGTGTADNTTFLRGDQTWQTVSGGSAAWGGITGTLSNQTDLNTALGTKEIAANKATANGYAGLDAGTKVPIAQIPTGSTGSTVCLGNDSRLSDARTPTTHAATHKSGGSDAIKLDECAVPTDVTTLNASTSAHGLMQKYPGDTSTFLRADGSFAAPTASASPYSPYAVGTLVVPTANFMLMGKRLVLTSSQRLTCQGTSRLRIL